MNYWRNKKDKLKQKFTGLADKDLVYKLGKESELVKKLQNKLGKTTKELLSIIIEF